MESKEGFRWGCAVAWVTRWEQRVTWICLSYHSRTPKISWSLTLTSWVVSDPVQVALIVFLYDYILHLALRMFPLLLLILSMDLLGEESMHYLNKRWVRKTTAFTWLILPNDREMYKEGREACLTLGWGNWLLDVFICGLGTELQPGFCSVSGISVCMGETASDQLCCRYFCLYK